MNGVTLKQFGEFYKKWNFVTARFREDTKEMRFVYANDAAYSALKSGGKYPDGAMFAKIGMITKEDEAFPSSAVPMGTVRYQFMIRDEKKFAQTGGWGYALFDGQGKLYPQQDVKTQEKACAACHALVPARQFVFSQIAPLGGADVRTIFKEHSKLSFTTVTTGSLSAEEKAKVPKNFPSVRQLKGEIENDAFMGTIDELMPLLMKEARFSGVPSVFVAKKEGYSVVILPERRNDETCRYSISVSRTVERCSGKGEPASGSPRRID